MNKTKIHYDKGSDILYLVLKSGPEEYAEEVTPYVTIEYDKNDKPIGIEIWEASKILGAKLKINKPVKQTQTLSSGM